MNYMINLRLDHLWQKFHSKLVGFKARLKAAEGQTFIEFLFLLLVLMGLSFGVIAGFNGVIANQWKAIVKAVAVPFENEDDFEL